MKITNATFHQSLHKGFIDRNIEESSSLVPKLLVNNESQNVLSDIISQLYKCKSFMITVAFITESGLAMLKSHLLYLKEQGIRGRILTSDYLGFNHPNMFRELMKIENVDVRITDVKGFHAKGYIFEHAHYDSFIVGSSNLTANALKVNYEHNILLSTYQNGELVHRLKEEFEMLWSEGATLDSSWLDTYEAAFVEQQKVKVRKVENVSNEALSHIQKPIMPNKMQVEALQNLSEIRNKGEHRALVISATGTGKTILCALDVRSFNPKRCLFIVHNEGILKSAAEAFKRVMMEPEDRFRLLTGREKNFDAKYIFSTIQTISKAHIYTQFKPDDFDYIIFDEAHRTAAKTYQAVFDYFKPRFMLGMTATPERTDELNIFERFDYNIAYEIRLQKALENDILCPFHYFGVTDYELNFGIEDDVRKLSLLSNDDKVKYIIDKTTYYGYSGDELVGLIFVSRKAEAKMLADKLTAFGIPSCALTGEDSMARRTEAIRALEAGELNYIITVDLFNEGIDIPKVNQVVMLRETQSSIIFIQQLGRGLRKSDNKDFVTVIDFIGNYKNNYLIPIALSGNQSSDKDVYRKFLTDNTSLQGVSTINFEEIARREIFDSINASKLNGKMLIKKAYETVENRLGRVPMLMDFIEQNSIDPNIILEKYDTFYDLLLEQKVEDYNLADNERYFLSFFSKELSGGLRTYEMTLIHMLRNEALSEEVIYQHFTSIDGQISREDIASVLRILDMSFFSGSAATKYVEPIILRDNNVISLNKKLEHAFKNPDFQYFVEDLRQLSLYNNETTYDGNNRLNLYTKYSRKDVMKLLNWKKDETSTVYGYKSNGSTCPIFITYHKEDDISDNTKYEDQFLNQEVLKWYTRSPRNLNSKELQPILNHKEAQIDLHVFVKKEDSEGSMFYYLGRAYLSEGTQQNETMANGKSVVSMHLKMEHPIRDDIYRYIVNK